jgi:hypothetical protein
VALGLPTGTAAARARVRVGNATLALTLAMVAYPPFTGPQGLEYAFLPWGPDWSRSLGTLARDAGLSARLDWRMLLLQVALLWAVALALRALLARRAPA